MSPSTRFPPSHFRGSEQDVNDELPYVGNQQNYQGSTPRKCELRIEGMTCGACVEVSWSGQQISNTTHESQSIEGVLRSQPGIYSVKVALLAERGAVEYDPSVWSTEKIISVSQLHLVDRLLRPLHRKYRTRVSMPQLFQ